MNRTLLVIAALLLAALFVWKAKAGLSEQDARQHFKNGALVVDVRTEREFQERHLPGAVNIPLDRLADELPRRLPDKGRVLLLHCRSGRRSGIAEKQLRQLGYTNAFSIGSFERAARVVGTTPRPAGDP